MQKVSTCTGQKLAEVAERIVCFCGFSFPDTVVHHSPHLRTLTRHLDMMTSKMVMMMLNIEEDRQRVLS